MFYVTSHVLIPIGINKSAFTMYYPLFTSYVMPPMFITEKLHFILLYLTKDWLDFELSRGSSKFWINKGRLSIILKEYLIKRSVWFHRKDEPFHGKQDPLQRRVGKGCEAVTKVPVTTEYEEYLVRLCCDISTLSRRSHGNWNIDDPWTRFPCMLVYVYVGYILDWFVILVIVLWT